MKTIIFQSEKKAKVYEVRCSKDSGCFKAGELLFTLRTDRISEFEAVTSQGVERVFKAVG